MRSCFEHIWTWPDLARRAIPYRAPIAARVHRPASGCLVSSLLQNLGVKQVNGVKPVHSANVPTANLVERSRGEASASPVPCGKGLAVPTKRSPQGERDAYPARMGGAPAPTLR